MELTLRLDVGCGSRPRGDVNVDCFSGGWNKQEADQDKGEFMNPKEVPNFVVASAEYLPFASDTFESVYSSHTIEHLHNPFKMLSEAVRVCSRKVVVKCPHRRGSGARRPFHVSYLDEVWFGKAARVLKVSAKSFISVAEDAPLTARFYQVMPKPFRWLYSRNILYRVVRKIERKLFGGLRLPFELETHITKTTTQRLNTDPIYFIVVHNDDKTFRRCFMSSEGIGSHIMDYDNKVGLGLGELYNSMVSVLLDRDYWLVFCHQDFILHESLSNHLYNKNKLGVYGVIGSRIGATKLFGQITQTDGSLVGSRLKEHTPVDTLDELCLITHTKAFREGLRFDKSFTFHYYGADLCTQAHHLGFDVMALQVNCQHKSRTLGGDIHTTEYQILKALFAKKWQRFLPITTTTGIVS